MNADRGPRRGCGGALSRAAARAVSARHVAAGAVATLLALAGPAPGLSKSEPVAAIDQRAPAVPVGLRAVDRPGDAGGHIQLTWQPSADSVPRLVGVGAADFTTRAGAAAFRPVVHLAGYRVYRWPQGGEPVLLATLAADSDGYVDSTAIDNVLYRYEVRAFDSAGESAAQIAAGSDEDTARMAAAVDNSFVPADADGRPIQGWFDHTDTVVDLNDFFLFADHFGRLEGEALYDARYDLDRSGRVDFDDFFLFVDNFGREVANAPAPGS